MFMLNFIFLTDYQLLFHNIKECTVLDDFK